MEDRGFFLTLQAIRRQLTAMPNDLYLVRLIHHLTRQPFPGERLWTAEQLATVATVRFLRARNREGCDIYVHPYAGNRNAGYPRLNGGFDSVQDNYVNGGHLLMEGDQRGGEYLDKEPADSPLLPETHRAWKTGLNAAEISVEKGARILKDALYVNHLYSTKPDGEKGVGPTCDIAFIDRQVGFRWLGQNLRTSPDSRISSSDLHDAP